MQEIRTLSSSVESKAAQMTWINVPQTDGEREVVTIPGTVQRTDGICVCF